MNYGHRLEFGTFITPRSAAPDTVVELARLSEQLGYNLVTFQDHPYQPAFLDTWTLLAWVAGKTERIRLSANVLNLPLRAPAVLARSAASLDLLSGGRFELALGAGGFWDAIAAMGGKKLPPGEAVDALEEAIDILRGFFDVGDTAPLRFRGDHYQLAGAQRGPTPLHNIPIWLGAYKPRMLRLIGKKADGWLPTLQYIKPGDLRAGNEIIDQAAIDAGRDPREIRRLLNISGQFLPTAEGFLQGPGEQWVNDLLPLALEDGIGTFILMSDDPQTLTQFAQEVVPALRERVLEELHGELISAPLRSTAIRSKRLRGIAYDSVPTSLAETVVEPGDVGYARVKSTYMRGGAPGIVFQVRNTDQIVQALAFARAHSNLPLSIRSGGHGISGRSTNRGGIVIDLSKLNRIEVLDESKRLVRIQVGAHWQDVAAVLQPYGWALSSGDYGGVGVGGLATAGGVGWLSRKYGLTIDHLRAVEMVLADGSMVHADADENPDLFWAVRGAGANFGIVTTFDFQVDPVGDVGWAQLLFDADETAGLLEKWGSAVEKAPRDLTSFIMMGAPRRDQPMLAQMMAVVDSNEPKVILDQLQPFANIAPLYDQNIYITPYANIVDNSPGGDHNAEGEPAARSGLIKHITPEFARAAENLLHSGQVFFFQIRAVGGAVSDVPADATAYGYRDANFSVTAFGANRDGLNALWDALAHHFEGLYISFETDLRPERLADAFPPATLARLRELKLRYDPDNVFRDNFNIKPEPVPA